MDYGLAQCYGNLSQAECKNMDSNYHQSTYKDSKNADETKNATIIQIQLSKRATANPILFSDVFLLSENTNYPIIRTGFYEKKKKYLINDIKNINVFFNDANKNVMIENVGNEDYYNISRFVIDHIDELLTPESDKNEGNTRYSRLTGNPIYSKVSPEHESKGDDHDDDDDYLYGKDLEELGKRYSTEKGGYKQRRTKKIRRNKSKKSNRRRKGKKSIRRRKSAKVL